MGVSFYPFPQAAFMKGGKLPPLWVRTIGKEKLSQWHTFMGKIAVCYTFLG
jgi:hypothetical protein